MGEEDAFVRAVVERPGDGLPRLAYADWLDERADPRGEYLRLLCAAAGWATPAGDRAAVVARLQELRPGLDPGWRTAVQRGVGWRTLFEVNLPPPADREFGTEYHFGPPATEEELAAAEAALGFRLPADVRGMLAEFNGVQSTTRVARQDGRDPEVDFLDLDDMVWEAEHLRDVGWHDHFSDGELDKVVLVRLTNNVDYSGVCVEAVAGQPAGAVIFLAHEVGELEAAYPNLFEFVSRFSEP